MSKYSRDKTIKALNDALFKTPDALFKTSDTLYKTKCVNWSGKCKEGEYYSEIISEKLLEDIGNFNIDKIERESYFQNHSGEIKAFTNRGEEILAKSLLNKKIEGIGEIFDYQIPLKKSQKDTGVGKIDLVSIDGDKLKKILFCVVYLKLIHIQNNWILIDSKVNILKRKKWRLEMKSLFPLCLFLKRAKLQKSSVITSIRKLLNLQRNLR